ncbi:MAG: ribosome recycling factor [Rhizobiales bacterium NRL2]|jgi:ribosome recycling factor|nr:MAG: ribosome recycling factor [Rhizobiales bacterium NRL2]
MAELDIDDMKRRMAGAVDALKKDLSGLRTGRASAGLLDSVTVKVYGSEMPLNQVATVNVPEARMLSVQVWDRNNAGAVEKAIRESNLGLNPAGEGQIIRVPIPELTEERRREYTKVAGQYAEQARVAVRNIRRHAMDELKKQEKDGDISQDDHRLYADEVQTDTDQTIKEIDQLLEQKQQEIMQV